MANAGMVGGLKRLQGNKKGQGDVLVLEVALVRVRDAGIEFLWNEPLPEWIHLDVRLVAQGRKENYRARGVVVDCRPCADGLWNVSLFFTDFARGENAWPPA